MSKKLYVGNMNYNTSVATLTELFSEYGEVISTKIIEDQFTGRSKGFGFVEMQNDEDAIKAINALNGKQVDDRELKVSEAFDKPKKNNFSRNNNNGFKKKNRYY